MRRFDGNDEPDGCFVTQSSGCTAELRAAPFWMAAVIRYTPMEEPSSESNPALSRDAGGQILRLRAIKEVLEQSRWRDDDILNRLFVFFISKEVLHAGH